jgi:phosphoglycerate dehydrogenase-like enzyme
MAKKLTIAVLPPRNMVCALFRPETWARLATYGATIQNESAQRNLDEAGAARLVAQAEVVITSWGSPPISDTIVNAAPKLRLHCHAAGTVKPLVSESEWDRGIIVTSAAAAIAVGVAQTTLAWILIAAKQAFVANEATHAGGWKDQMRFPAGDITGRKIGIVGASHVGRKVIEYLRPHEVEILLYDPYVSPEAAKELGVRKVSLDDLMQGSDVVSLHAPSIPETRHMINRTNLKLAPDGVTIINTARGSLIDEEALVAELTTGRIWAILDVTDPEPPAPDHPFRKLPNCILTPHIAGTVAAGRLRLGDYVAEEVRRFANGEPQRYGVTRDMLSRIA